MENLQIYNNEGGLVGFCDVLTDTYIWVFIYMDGYYSFRISIAANKNHSLISY